MTCSGANVAPELDQGLHSNDTTKDNAARTIQRNYRGHRARRQLRGMHLDASTRWLEVVREAQYRNLTQPRSRDQPQEHIAGESIVPKNDSNAAQARWRTAGGIAMRANNDDTSDTDGDEGMSKSELEEHRRAKHEQKKSRDETARMMGMQYFLELVDQKHRYGSHLRKYHAVWQNANTKENFFYWLDHGDGRTIDAPECTREVLDRDRVRYLSREERQQYLVVIDDDGRLRWAKNGERVETSPEYRDSMNGIVKKEDLGPVYGAPDLQEKDNASSESSDEDTNLGSEQGRTNSDLTFSNSPRTTSPHSASTHSQATQSRTPSSTKSLTSAQTLPPAAFLDHLVRRPSKSKKAKWIFVADTSFRLYIGVKQSGAFQHSSFMHGARVMAAGQIRVKNGQLRRLHPLSGHYRPPRSNFRELVRSLKEHGADLSRVSIPESYAVLWGTEEYKKATTDIKQKISGLSGGVEKILRPQEARKKEEKEIDQSSSARREHEVLDQKRQEQHEAKKETWRRRLGLRSKSSSSSPGAAEH